MKKLSIDVLAQKLVTTYRVWDGEKFLPQSETQLTGEGLLRLDPWDPDGNIEYPEGIIEFCTGLYDFQGEMLYDGDIIVVMGVRNCPGSACFCSRPCTIQRSYSRSAFMIARNGEVEWYLGDCVDIKKLGNIHENPELIDSEQLYLWNDDMTDIVQWDARTWEEVKQ